ncbi:MAG: GvpL/GvpF family gas vesicle protein [Parachlamydiaceae bacterium]
MTLIFLDNSDGPSEENEQTGLYLYCFAHANSLDQLTTLGTRESPIFVKPFQHLLAILKRVPLEEFCGIDAEKNMQELSWLVPRVHEHEAIIEQSMAYSPVFPAPFGTIFSSADALMSFFEINYDVMIDFLNKMTLMEEWGVKGLFNKEKAKNRLLELKIAENAPYLDTLKKGMRYFQEKKIEKELDAMLSHLLQKILNDELNALSENAVSIVKRKVVQGISGGHDKIVANWAFLIHHHQSDFFKMKLASINATHQEEGIHFEMSGPWPPYSFCPPLSGVKPSNVASL